MLEILFNKIIWFTFNGFQQLNNNRKLKAKYKKLRYIYSTLVTTHNIVQPCLCLFTLDVRSAHLLLDIFPVLQAHT